MTYNVFGGMLNLA